MHPRLWLLCGIGIFCSVVGCMGGLIARDGISIRQAVLEMYTDQVLDNLIRAHSNMPFVQLKYSSIQANDSLDVSLNTVFDHSVVSASNLATGAITRTVTDDFKPTAVGDQKRTMNFTCDPITDQNDIYRMYIAFANDPGLFMVTEQKPRCPTHVMRKCGKRYYWVPQEAGPAFLELCMKTTFMRGKDDGNLTPAAVTVRIVDVQSAKVAESLPSNATRPDSDDAPNTDSTADAAQKKAAAARTRAIERDIENAELIFDKDVPNGDGILVVDLDNGRHVKVGVLQIKSNGNQVIDLGQLTKRLGVQLSPKADGLRAADLKGKSARFYSNDFPPEIQQPSPAIQSINENLNTIRSQIQLR